MAFMIESDTETEAPAMRFASAPFGAGLGETYVVELWECAEGDFQLCIVGLHDETNEVIGTYETLTEALSAADDYAEEQELTTAGEGV